MHHATRTQAWTSNHSSNAHTFCENDSCSHSLTCVVHSLVGSSAAHPIRKMNTAAELPVSQDRRYGNPRSARKTAKPYDVGGFDESGAIRLPARLENGTFVFASSSFRAQPQLTLETLPRPHPADMLYMRYRRMSQPLATHQLHDHHVVRMARPAPRTAALLAMRSI